MMASHTANFADCLHQVLTRRDVLTGVEDLITELVALRERKGRLFVIGVGGGAANASHAVNDFRKLCGIEAYAPTDSVAELTARANDEGFSLIFSSWLVGSVLSERDAILVFSVGGGLGDVSACITEAVTLARLVRARVLGVVGRGDGTVAKYGDVVVVTGVVGKLLTPVTETVQTAILHALVSDPLLQIGETTW